jgi:hypothetical protein
VLGAIIGIVDLVEVIERGGRFGWRLANPRRFAEPVQCCGRLMLWTPAVIRALGLPPRVSWGTRRRCQIAFKVL